ncbi:MAG: hypothetical protein ACRDOJ_13110, partial [Nocardioidaceae bacterium]
WVLAVMGTTLISAVALGVVAPVMGAAADVARRRRWRHWHPPTAWLTHADEPVGSSTGRHAAPRTRACLDTGAAVQMVTAETSSAPAGPGSRYAPVTLVRARLEPTERLELPGHEGQGMLVFVVAGEGVVGAQHLPVRAGQVAVLDPGEPVSVDAGTDLLSAPLEVLVLGEVPANGHARRAGARVVDVEVEVTRSLRALHALTQDFTPELTDRMPAADGGPDHVTHIRPRQRTSRPPVWSVPNPRVAPLLEAGNVPTLSLVEEGRPEPPTRSTACTTSRS